MYAPAFLVAGKLDEALKIVKECAEIHKALKETKSSEKKLKKLDKAMKERLLKDSLRIYSVKSSYFTAAASVRVRAEYSLLPFSHPALTARSYRFSCSTSLSITLTL